MNIKFENKAVVLRASDVLNETNKVEKELDGNGRILLGKSGTETVIRVIVEAQSDEMCRSIANRFTDVVKEKYEVK